MADSDRMDAVCKEFLRLKGEQQDHILGIAQALAFAAAGKPPRRASAGSCAVLKRRAHAGGAAVSAAM